jgi:curved DNA-binding protein CbpA
MKVSFLPDFILEGSLEDYPLPMLFALALERKFSGILHIKSESGEPWVWFIEGFPSGVFLPKSQEFLGQIMRELGMIDDNAFNQSLMEMAKTKKLQGQILLAMGAIKEEQLERALSVQMARKLSRLFSIRQGTFSFGEDEEPANAIDPIRVNPYALIYAAIHTHYKEEDLKRGLTPLVGKSCKASGLFVERKDLFEFPKDDMQDAEMLREFRLPQEFVRTARCGPLNSMMMLLALFWCGMLEIEEPDMAQPLGVTRSAGAADSPSSPKAPSPAGPSHTPSRPAAGGMRSATPARGIPRAAPAVSDDLRRKINQKFEEIKTADFFKVLEVEKNATTEVIKKAFLTLTKVYHPDRIAKSDDPELRNRMEAISSKINEAAQVLMDPNARAQYENTQGKQDRGAPRPEEAKIQFAKGLVFFKKRDFLKASESFKWAADLDPKNGDYLAHFWWSESMKLEGKESERLEKCKAGLLEVAKNFPDSFWAVRFLSLLYQKQKDQANYEQYLKKAYKINSKDLDVVREVRLITSRKQKADREGRFFGIKIK